MAKVIYKNEKDLEKTKEKLLDFKFGKMKNGKVLINLKKKK